MGWKLGLMKIDAAPQVQPTPAPPIKPREPMRHAVNMLKYKRGR
jgi:hypothetical protein